jgi:hypothetical protein
LQKLFRDIAFRFLDTHLKVSLAAFRNLAMLEILESSLSSVPDDLKEKWKESVKTDNMSSRALPEDKLQKSLSTFFAYYEKLRPRAAIASEQISQDLIDFLRMKALGQTEDEGFLQIKSRLESPVNEMIDYFRNAFSTFERQWMPRLNLEKMSLREQGDLLNDIRSKNINSLDLGRVLKLRNADFGAFFSVF